jgi:hypothetical protein
MQTQLFSNKNALSAQDHNIFHHSPVLKHIVTPKGALNAEGQGSAIDFKFVI